MGLFSPNGYNVYTESMDIENMTYDECMYENSFEAASYIVAESENNYNTIIKAIALDELGVYESTGQEMVYEAANFKAFFGKIKDFFKKLWEKIKGMFQKFFAKINAVVLKDKEFVKKYKKAILDAKTKDFEYKGFEFTHLDDKIKAEADINKDLQGVDNISKLGDTELVGYITDISDDSYTTKMDNFRGSLVNTGKVEEGEFSDALFEYYRNGEKTKDTIDKVNPSELLKVIEGTATAKKTAENDLKTLKKSIDDIIKTYDKAEKSALSNMDTKPNLIKAYSCSSKLLKDRMNAVTLWSGAKLKALKDQNAQAKSVCVKLLTYKPKNESAGFVHTEGGSYLDSVVFK